MAFIRRYALTCGLTLIFLSAASASFALKPRGKAKKPAAATQAEKPKPEANTNTAPPGVAPPSGSGFRDASGNQRIDFDERLVQGQTRRAGGVYLFDRKKTNLTSLVKRRLDYRPELELSIYE